MSFPSQVDDGVELNVSNVESRTDVLELTYEVVNGGGASIYLLNGLFHRRGAAGWVVDRNLVYCSVENRSVLHLKKHMVDVPEEIDVEYPEVPFASEVAAGAASREKLRLAVPVVPHDPYLPQARADTPYEVAGVVLTIGYVVDDGALQPSAPAAQGAEGFVRLSYSDVRSRQRLKSVGPIGAAVATVAVAGTT